MAKKVKRNMLILVALLVANIIGFILADTYFKRQADTTTVGPTVGTLLESSQTRVVFTAKWIGFGMEFLRKIGD